MKLNRQQKNLLKYFKKCYRRAKDPLNQSIYDDCIEIHNDVCQKLLENRFSFEYDEVRVNNNFSNKYTNWYNFTQQQLQDEQDECEKNFDKALKDRVNFYKKVVDIYNTAARNAGFKYRLEITGEDTKEGLHGTTDLYDNKGKLHTLVSRYTYMATLSIDIILLDGITDTDNDPELEAADLF